MSASEPQFMYMVLVLPSLFGLTLVGEGISKVLQQKLVGWISVVVGIGFIAVVFAAYLVFANTM